MSITGTEDTSGCCKDDRKTEYDKSETKKSKALPLLGSL